MRMLLTLTVLASLSLANAQAVDDKTFFSGAHIGETIDECMAYYYPHGGPTRPIGAPALGPIPLGGRTPSTGAIADAGSCWHSGAPEGEEEVDFRTNSNPARQRRVLIDYRTSDRKIVCISYWKVDDGNEKSFSKEEIRYLTALNSGQGVDRALFSLKWRMTESLQ
jgi:hypothetical protein